MTDVRIQLIDKLVAEVGANGLVDRSLREVATAIGSSHRMLNYHFGSRDGLVRALVERAESSQRDLLQSLAEEIHDPAELVRALDHLVQPEMRPFIRLFFECVALTGGEGLTDPWIDDARPIAERLGGSTDADILRLGVAVSRGLLIDVLATDDPRPATRSLELFLDLWSASSGELTQ
ncbi:MAG: hypothetical protein R2710_17545 [Acidimicrobiales bacterium]